MTGPADPIEQWAARATAARGHRAAVRLRARLAVMTAHRGLEQAVERGHAARQRLADAVAAAEACDRDVERWTALLVAAMRVHEASALYAAPTPLERIDFRSSDRGETPQADPAEGGLTFPCVSGS